MDWDYINSNQSSNLRFYHHRMSNKLSIIYYLLNIFNYTLFIAFSYVVLGLGSNSKQLNQSKS